MAYGGGGYSSGFSASNYNDTAYASTNDLGNSTVNRARVGGSTFTMFVWDRQPIAFARQISVQSPQAVAQTVPIQPLDSPYPVQLVTPQATTMGSLVLELYDLYGSNIWQRLTGSTAGGGTNTTGSLGDSPGNPKNPGPVDLASLFQAVAAADPIHIYKVITPPTLAGQQINPYTEEYHNCVISSVAQGETIEIGTMEVVKQIMVNYTHITQGGYNPLLATSGLVGVSTITSLNGVYSQPTPQS